jgi:hypothetical protein
MPCIDTDLANDPNYIVKVDTYLHAIFCTIPYIADNVRIAPLVKQEERVIDMQTLNE